LNDSIQGEFLITFLIKPTQMSYIPHYAASVREAISSNDVAKMKAALAQGKKQVRDHGDLSAALIELEEAIEKLKG